MPAGQTRPTIRITVIHDYAEFIELVRDAVAFLRPDAQTDVSAHASATPLEAVIADRPQLIVMDGEPREGGSAISGLMDGAQGDPRLAGVPVVVCSTDGMADGAARGADGRVHSLGVPFSIDELRQVLEAAGV
jgi:hypothetical protein